MKLIGVLLALMLIGCGDDSDGPTEADAVSAAKKVNEGKNGSKDYCHICTIDGMCEAYAYWEPAKLDGEWTTVPVQVDYENDRDQYCDENDEWIPQ